MFFKLSFQVHLSNKEIPADQIFVYYENEEGKFVGSTHFGGWRQSTSALNDAMYQINKQLRKTLTETSGLELYFVSLRMK